MDPTTPSDASALGQLRLFVERAPSPMALFDTQLRYLATSERWVSDYALDPDADYRGRSHYDVFPEIGEAWKRDHRDALAGRVIQSELDRFDREDGSVQWLRYEVRPWYVSDSEVGGIVMLTEDVTAVVAQAGLSAQQAALLEAADDASVILWAVDASGAFTLFRGKAMQKLGVASGDLVGRDIREAYADLPAVLEGIDAALRGEPREWTVEVDGVVFDTTVEPIQGADGTVEGAFGVSVDVTARIAAERRAADQRDRLQRLLEATTSEGGFAERAQHMLATMTELLDLDQGVLARIDATRYTALVAFAARGEALEPGDEIPRDASYCSVALELDGPLLVEHMALSDHADRHCYHVNKLEAYAGIPVYVDGAPFGAIGFSSEAPARRAFTEEDRDLLRLAAQWAGALLEREAYEDGLRQTEARLRQTVTALEASKAEAEAASRAKSSFLASMSHEIRTPMNAVIGFGELLSSTPLAFDQREYVEMMQRAGERLLSLIDDILDFSKAESGRIALDVAPFRVEAFLVAALEQAAPAAAGRGVELSYTLDPELPAQLLGDEGRLHQILSNLVSNAVKFTEEGHVEVTAQLWAEAPEDEHGVWLEVAVEDTGIGIAPDRLNVIFDAFTQADAGTTRRFGGTGLGLAIARRFAELMDGSLSAESEPGVGSTFRLRVPLEPTETSRRVVLTQARTPIAGRHVLVVDDDDDGRQALVARLARWGATVEATGDPRQALDWIREGRAYDLGVLDMRMPELDGVQLAEAIRAHRPAAELPLLVLSSEATIRHAPDLVAATLLKPVPAPSLHAILKRMLDHQTPSAEPPLVPAEPAERSGSGLRILLAEDEPDNQTLAIQMLRSLGYDADVAADGAEALDRIRQHAYDLVLMDVMMPELDGLEVTRRVRRELPADQQPRIIALTARAMQADREACIAAGMDGYLAKPVRIDALQRALVAYA